MKIQNTIIKKIITASGGEVWRRPKSLQLLGDATFTPHGKLENKVILDEYKMYRIFPDQNNAAHEANGKVRFDAFYKENLFFQLKFDGQNSKMDLGDIAKPHAAHFQWSNNFGFGILRFADQEGFDVESLVEDQIEGYPCDFIKITDREKHETFFAIDQVTHLCRMVGFTTPLGYHHRIYSEYQKAPDGFQVPTRMRVYYDGIKWMDVRWRQFITNETIDDSVFI